MLVQFLHVGLHGAICTLCRAYSTAEGPLQHGRVATTAQQRGHYSTAEGPLHHGRGATTARKRLSSAGALASKENSANVQKERAA